MKYIKYFIFKHIEITQDFLNSHYYSKDFSLNGVKPGCAPSDPY
jgi:hypothetical protein